MDGNQPLGRDGAWIGAGIFLGHLTIYGTLALVLYNTGVIHQYNVFFDADPPRYLGGFAHGWQRPDWIHAIPAAFSLPIRAAAIFLARLTGRADPAPIREILAAGIAPLAGAAYELVLFSLGRALGLERRTAVALMLLSTTSVAAAVFFSIPESYGISAVVSLAAWSRAVRSLKRNERPSYWQWSILTALAGAVTITEAASIAVLYSAVEHTQTRRLRATAVRTVGLVLLAVLFCGIAGAAIRRVYDYSKEAPPGMEPGPVEEALSFRARFAPRDLGGQVLGLAALPAMTVIAPEPRWVRYDKAVERHWRYHSRSSYAGVHRSTIALAALSLALAIACFVQLRGPTGAFWSDPIARAGALACVGIGVVQGGLHLVFGRELFLYAMHFQPAVLVLIALLLRPLRRRTSRAIALALFALAAANTLVVTRMFLSLG